METNRFETFLDAIIAIVITVLVLKLAQPADASWSAIWALNSRYITYLLCFLIIFNTWYNDHNLFQMVERIDNSVIMVYGLVIFIISLVPYFATWVSLNYLSIPAQSMFGLLFLLVNVFYTLSTYLICRANRDNERIQKVNLKDYRRYVPIAIILMGFALTYTVWIPGIYFSCILATFSWFVLVLLAGDRVESSERFEALFDAILAIILTIIVLEITMASHGSWEALLDLKIEFIAYAISFISVYCFWNYNNNLFNLTDMIDYKAVWLMGALMFVLSLIPYFSIFVSENFYSFVAQASYGMDFFVACLLSIATAQYVKKINPGGMNLHRHFNTRIQFTSTAIIIAVGFLIGYLFYPPAIMFSCLISILSMVMIMFISKD